MQLSSGPSASAPPCLRVPHVLPVPLPCTGLGLCMPGGQATPVSWTRTSTGSGNAHTWLSPCSLGPAWVPSAPALHRLQRQEAFAPSRPRTPPYCPLQGSAWPYIPGGGRVRDPVGFEGRTGPGHRLASAHTDRSSLSLGFNAISPLALKEGTSSEARVQGPGSESVGSGGRRVSG